MKDIFHSLISNYTPGQSLHGELWNEIQDQYTKKSRHYHTLAHLQNMYDQLLEVKDDIHSWDTSLFSLFYHDIIYNAAKGNNEEKSAALARKRMISIGVPSVMVSNCKEQILATKQHAASTDTDTCYFLDADLSILGLDWDKYAAYFQQVRKEYAIYPDMLYNPGRKKVLQHFLQMPHIFKTDHFINKFERQAKENLQKEIEILT